MKTLLTHLNFCLQSTRKCKAKTLAEVEYFTALEIYLESQIDKLRKLIAERE